MQSGKIISLSVWLMISFNVILAFAAVWSFQRMSPEIRQVYEGNVLSLEAAENMLLALENGNDVDLAAFRKALISAENNITEQGEKETLASIREILTAYEKGNHGVVKDFLPQIRELSSCNRKAIRKSAEKTQWMRQAGAWGIVFMTFFFLMAALFFEQRLRRSLLQPLGEINSVLEARRKGDRFRRCSSPDASLDMKKIFRAINELLDRTDSK